MGKWPSGFAMAVASLATAPLGYNLLDRAVTGQVTVKTECCAAGAMYWFCALCAQRCPPVTRRPEGATTWAQRPWHLVLLPFTPSKKILTLLHGGSINKKNVGCGTFTGNAS